MADWIAIGRDGVEFAAFAMQDGSVTGRARGANEATAMGGLSVETAIVIRIGEGPPDTAPCAVLPKTGVVLPVITQDNPPDVLTAWLRLWIAGYLAKHAHWDGVIWAFDGDISHWIHVSADEIISFASFLTPRLVTALKGAGTPCQMALTNTMSRPERLAAHLRQAELGGDPRAITGHLLGAELAAARPYWLGQQVAIITDEGDALGYAGILEAQGVPVSTCAPKDLVEDGLSALGKALGLGY